MNKEQKIKRKFQRKTNQRRQETTLDLDVLKEEVCDVRDNTAFDDASNQTSTLKKNQHENPRGA